MVDNKKVNVIWENERLRESYQFLEENDAIKKKIDWVIEEIKKNPAFGEPIPKRLIPKKYAVNNAFWVQLPGAWRLIYSLKSFNEIEILAIILEYMNHKNYEKVFKY